MQATNQPTTDIDFNEINLFDENQKLDRSYKRNRNLKNASIFLTNCVLMLANSTVCEISPFNFFENRLKDSYCPIPVAQTFYRKLYEKYMLTIPKDKTFIHENGYFELYEYVK